MKKFSVRLKVLFIALFLFVGVSTLFNIASAQTHAVDQTPMNQSLPGANSDVPYTTGTYTQSVVLELIGSAYCLLVGVNPVEPQGRCIGFDVETKRMGYVEPGRGGAVALMGNMIGMTYNIPVSSSQYLAHLGDNFGITKKAYAQTEGYGFGSLSPLLPIWQVMRNLAYLIIVLIIILIGLGIMFRFQIDPRTVMTIQNQIPKIVIGLVLITFSYAIAGFLIDMMWVAMYIVVNIFSQIDRSLNTPEFLTNLRGRNPFELAANGNITVPGGIMGIVGNAAGAVSSIISDLFSPKDSRGEALGGLIGMVIGSLTIGIGCFFVAGVGGLGVCAGLSAIAGGLGGAFAGGQILGAIGFLFAGVIIFFAVIIALFRLWFALIRTYVFILASIIFSPFFILGGILPGSQGGFGMWFRDLIANLSAYPTALTLFLLGNVVIDQFDGAAIGSVFSPPLVGNPGSPNAIKALIGFGVIMIAPEAVNMVREALKAPSFKYAAAIAKEVGGGAEAGGKLVRTTGSALGTSLDTSGHVIYKGGPLANVARILGFFK